MRGAGRTLLADALLFASNRSDSRLIGRPSSTAASLWTPAVTVLEDAVDAIFSLSARRSVR
jgi:hypothetical protein